MNLEVFESVTKAPVGLFSFFKCDPVASGVHTLSVFQKYSHCIFSIQVICPRWLAFLTVCVCMKESIADASHKRYNRRLVMNGRVRFAVWLRVTFVQIKFQQFKCLPFVISVLKIMHIHLSQCDSPSSEMSFLHHSLRLPSLNMQLKIFRNILPALVSCPPIFSPPVFCPLESYRPFSECHWL